jgi:hypothetical protein
MKLLRRVKVAPTLKRRESKIVTLIIMKKDRVRNEPGEELYLKIIRENDAVVHGVQCDRIGNVMFHPINQKAKLERIMWKDAIKKRKEIT